MSAFPSSPADGDEFTLGNRTFTYNDTLGLWRVARASSSGSIVQSSGGAQVVSSTSEFDLNPPIGKIFYSQADSALFVFDGADYSDPVSGTKVASGNWTTEIDQLSVIRTVNMAALESGTTAAGIYFKEDGTKLFIYWWSGFGYRYGDVVSSYTLSTPWDISTAAYEGFFGIGTSGSPGDIYVTPDGLTMYVMQTDNQAGYMLKSTFGTAWDITTLSGKTQIERLWGHRASAMHIGSEGSKLYFAGHLETGSYYVESNLPTAYDVGTRTQVNEFNGSDRQIHGIFTNPSGTRLYGFTDTDIEQYEMTTPFDTSTATNRKVVDSPNNNNGGLFFSTTGEYMYVLYSTGSLVQYG